MVKYKWLNAVDTFDELTSTMTRLIAATHSSASSGESAEMTYVLWLPVITWPALPAIIIKISVSYA